MLRFCPMRWKHKLVKTTRVRRKELPGRRTIVTLNESQVSEVGQWTRMNVCMCVCVCVCVCACSHFTVFSPPSRSRHHSGAFWLFYWERKSKHGSCVYVCVWVQDNCSSHREQPELDIMTHLPAWSGTGEWLTHLLTYTHFSLPWRWADGSAAPLWPLLSKEKYEASVQRLCRLAWIYCCVGRADSLVVPGYGRRWSCWLTVAKVGWRHISELRGGDGWMWSFRGNS